MIAVPYVEQGEKVGIRMLEGGVGGISLLGFFRRTLARIADAQGGSDDRRLLEASLLAGFEQHAGYLGIEGHACHDMPFSGKEELPAFSADGPQFYESIVSVLDVF